MITINDGLKKASVDEVWAVRVWYDDPTERIINMGTANNGVGNIGVLNVGGSLTLTRVSGENNPYQSVHPLVNFFEKQYTLNIPSNNAYNGTYSVKNGYTASTTQFKRPSVPAFTPFATDEYRITPVRPYFTLATSAFTDSDGEYYDPVISKVSSINDTIDIIKSKSKTSNISLSIINKATTGRSSTSKLIGDSKYSKLMFATKSDFSGVSVLNRKCEIFSVVNGDPSTMTKIYEGRVDSMSIGKGLLKISVNAQKPYTNKLIPSERDPNLGTITSYAYGNYSNTSSADNYSTNTLYPVPYAFSDKDFNNNHYKLPNNLASYSNVVPHYYDKVTGKYFPLMQSNYTTPISETANEGSSYYSVVDRHYRKNIISKASINENGSKLNDASASGIYEGSKSIPEITNSSIANTYDNPSSTNETTTYGQCYKKVFYTGSTILSLDYNAPSTGWDGGVVVMGSVDITGGYTHKLDSDVVIKTTYGHVDIWYHAHPSETLNQYADYGFNNCKIVLSDADQPDASNLIQTLETFDTAYYNANGGTHTPIQLTSTIAKATYEGLGKPSVRFGIPAIAINVGNNSYYEYYLTCRFYDIILSYRTKIDQTDQAERESAILDIERVYIGSNGIARSWDTGNPCIRPHEIHRDLLAREIGVTATPDGWADLETARSGFVSRYWITEETDLEEVLDLMQEEGAFIFRYNAQGNPSYVYVKDSYSASDVSATISIKDVSAVSSKTTSLKDLITKIKFNYNRDPETEKTSDTLEFEKGEAREKYSIPTKEQVYEKSLDAVVDVAGVTALSDYLFKIASQPKSVVDLVIVNPAYLGLEVGDIIQINTDMYNDIIGIFGASELQTTYYMITKIRRTLGKGLKITIRQVSE